jgi:diguanylate cyclase (GGDEF)-like protein
MQSPTIPPAVSAALARAESLPSIPAVAVEVLRLTEDPDCTLDDLVQVIQTDPALAAKLLKLSNSSLFSVGQEVTTLKRATMVLGLKTVKLMSLSFSLASNLPHAGSDFDFRMYWQRSLVAAVAGRAFAEAAGSRLGDEAFLCGLLSNIGQLVMSQGLSELYAPVLERAGARWPTVQLEDRVLGFSSADVANALLANWSLPPLVRVPVAYMYRFNQLPPDVGQEVRRLTQMMAVTGLIVCVLCDAEKGPVYRKLYDLGVRSFGMEAPAMDDLLIGLEAGIRETAEMLNISAGTTDHREILERARGQLIQVSLGATADLRQAERRANDLSVQNQELLQRATRDKLTGLPNRAAFDEALAHEVHARMAPGATRCLGLLLADVDHFKRFNDTWGHRAGDAVLEAMGRVLGRLTRKGDLAARYGGEEFVLILPATTPAHLRTVAERVRQAIAAESIEFEGQHLCVTASFGGACLELADGPEAGARLLSVADASLYAAKNAGRNQSVIAETPLGAEGESA